jgi:hypothetical protein
VAIVCPVCEERRISSKTRDQEKKYHAMLNDVAAQCRHLNEAFSDDDWKRLCVHQFRKESMDDPKLAEYWKKNTVRLVPSLDGSGLVALGDQTRKFPKYVANAFIEWLYAYGADNNVTWTDPTRPPLEVYEHA